MAEIDDTDSEAYFRANREAILAKAGDAKHVVVSGHAVEYFHSYAAAVDGLMLCSGRGSSRPVLKDVVDAQLAVAATKLHV